MSTICPVRDKCRRKTAPTTVNHMRRKIVRRVMTIEASISWRTPQPPLIRIIVGHTDDCGERESILLEDQRGLQPRRSAVDMMLTARCLQELARRRTFRGTRASSSSTKLHDFSDRTPMQTIPVRFGVPSRKLAVIPSFSDGMCVRLDYCESRDMYDVQRGLGQGLGSHHWRMLR